MNHIIVHKKGDKIKVIDKDKDYIGDITVEEYQRVRVGEKRGVQIKLSFKAKTDKYSNYNFVQTVETNDKPDVMNPDLVKTYYYNDAHEGYKPWYNHEFTKNGAEFYDNPVRNFTVVGGNTPYWKGELHLVGIRNNTAISLFSFKYGFSIYYNATSGFSYKKDELISGHKNKYSYGWLK
ncbi:hypothetical protein [Empedobacter tilapiae]